MKYRGLLLPMILAAMCGDDAFVLNTKRGKGMQSTYRREKIVRTENTCKEWCETCCGIILPLFAQGQKSQSEI